MEIKEAIAHALEKAQELGDCECAREHLQLAHWLQELLEIKQGGGVSADDKNKTKYKIEKE